MNQRMFTVSGRFILNGTRKVVVVSPQKVLAADQNQAKRQMIPVIEHMVRKDHKKMVRLTEAWACMNLRAE